MGDGGEQGADREPARSAGGHEVKRAVEGIVKLGSPKAETPVAWCKQTQDGMGLIRIHWARDEELTACGVLNFKRSRYVAPGYSPLHVAYATDASAIVAAFHGVRYANKTVPASSVCKTCRRASESFDFLVTSTKGS
jgi:hypothetical protein